MIGIKSLCAVALAATTLAIAGWRGALEPEHLAHLSLGAAFAIGLFASLAAALIGVGWRPQERSHTALGLRARRPVLVQTRQARELPALVQRVLLVGAFGGVAVGTLGNVAAARIANLPDELARPSRAEFCQPEAPGEQAAAEPEPEPPAVDQAGCALVKRAYALGYAKTLGSCAPKTIAAIAPVAVATPREPCTRRQLDEPFVHYAWRKLVDTASGVSPGDAVGDRIDGIRTRLDYVGDLLADIKHAVTGTPHASHHLWVDLPDPRPGTLAERFTGRPRCATVFADLPLWPAWPASASPSAVFEHVFGQLLFATRFGTTASCSDFTIHWDAPPDACPRLAADPAGFLGETDALAPIRAVLDRRRRQLAMRELAAKLGAPATLPEPPPARAVISLACLRFTPAAPSAEGAALQATGRDVRLEGEPIALRELVAPPIVATGAGPIAVYQAIALLYGGTLQTESAVLPVASPRAADLTLRDPEFSLAGLEALVDADPFAGHDAPLGREDVVEVYPFEHHLHRFVDAFRRIYLPQRGRL